MAVLKDLIVHGRSRFINGIDADKIEANAIKADSGIFNQLIATTLEAKNASIDELTAQNATVFGVMDVKGKLQTNQWEAASIANIGGNFYISPTGKSSSGTVTITRTSAASGSAAAKYSVTMSGTFGVGTTSGTIWVSDAYGMATGNVSVGTKKYPLGTCDGPLSNISTGTNTITGFTISNVESAALDIIFDENASLISSNAISSKPGTDLQVSVYLGKSGSNYTPVGILLTSYGKDNRQYIDIYNGSNSAGTSITGFADPVVRIGDLTGLNSYTQANKYTITPSGWGIYTSNGYFKGEVYAEQGYIGGFTIGSTDIHNGKTSRTETTNNGVWVGTDGIGFGKGVTYFSLDGTGKIGPWTLTTTALYNSKSSYNASVSGGGVYIGTDYIAGGNGEVWWLKKDGSAKIGAMTLSTAGVLTLGSISLNASGTATIGPWTVNSTSIYKGNATQGTAGTGNMYFGNSGLSISNTFTVSNAGVLNATGATLKSVTLQDGNGKTRAAIDNNGLHIYDSSSNLKADFSTDINLYGGSSTTGAYPSININATNGITMSQSATDYMRINSSGMDIRRSSASYAFFGVENSAPYSRIGKGTQGNSFLVIKDSSLSLFGQANAESPIFTITQGGDEVIGGNSTSITLPVKSSGLFGDYTYLVYNRSTVTFNATSQYKSSGISTVTYKICDAASTNNPSRTYTETLNFGQAVNNVKTASNNNITITYNVTTGAVSATLNQALFNVTTNNTTVISYQPYSSAFLTGPDIANGDSYVYGNSGTITLYHTPLSGSTFKLMDGTFMNTTTLCTFTVNGTSQTKSVTRTKTVTVDADDGTSTSTTYSTTFSVTYNGSDTITFTKTSGQDVGIDYPVTDYEWALADVQMKVLALIDLTLHEVSAYSVGAFSFGVRDEISSSGGFSSIMGYHLTNSNANSLVVGQYNENIPCLFAVGNGTDEKRSNSLIVNELGQLITYQVSRPDGGEDNLYYNTGYTASNSITGAELFMGIGQGGQNRGIYDYTAERWMIYTNKDNQVHIPTDLYLRGHTRPVGYQVYKSASQSKSSSSDYANISGCYVDLTAGAWIITYSCACDLNVTGKSLAARLNNATTDTAFNYSRCMSHSSNTGAVAVTGILTVRLSSTCRFYVQAFQNSGSAKNITGYIRAMLIS